MSYPVYLHNVIKAYKVLCERCSDFYSDNECDFYNILKKTDSCPIILDTEGIYCIKFQVKCPKPKITWSEIHQLEKRQ